MHGLTIYMKQIRVNFLAGLQYKGWPLMIINVLFAVITDPIGMILMFSRFGSIGVWTMERILMMYALAVASFGMAETFCRGFDSFPWHMIRSGEFDRVLLRPVSIVAQIAGSRFHIHRMARMFTGIGAVIWCLIRMQVQVEIIDGVMLIFALLGGFVMYSGVFLMTSGLSFFTIKGLDWIFILTNASYQVTRIPMEHMPRMLKGVFIFFMPMLVISYYPASVVCGWGEAPWLGWVALPAGLMFFVLSYGIWRFGMRHYKSTGS